MSVRHRPECHGRNSAYPLRGALCGDPPLQVFQTLQLHFVVDVELLLVLLLELLELAVQLLVPRVQHAGLEAERRHGDGEVQVGEPAAGGRTENHGESGRETVAARKRKELVAERKE